MKAYLFVTKIRIQSALAYRFNVISTILIQCLLMFAMACFWNAAYGGTESVSGVREQDMLTYTMVSVIMGNLLTMGVEGRIESSVKSGSVALDMLKPVNIYGIYLAEDLGDSSAAYDWHCDVWIPGAGICWLLSILSRKLFYRLFD